MSKENEISIVVHIYGDVSEEYCVAKIMYALKDSDVTTIAQPLDQFLTNAAPSTPTGAGEEAQPKYLFEHGGSLHSEMQEGSNKIYKVTPGPVERMEEQEKYIDTYHQTPGAGLSSDGVHPNITPEVEGIIHDAAFRGEAETIELKNGIRIQGSGPEITEAMFLAAHRKLGEADPSNPTLYDRYIESMEELLQPLREEIAELKKERDDYREALERVRDLEGLSPLTELAETDVIINDILFKYQSPKP
jgi:hypothetical protein